MSNVSDLMGQTVEKIRQSVDANTIIGQPIVTADGTTLIPITKINIGIGVGGSDLKHKESGQVQGFGGGSGAGITVNPVGFIVVSNGDVTVLPISGNPSSTADKVVELVPEIVNKITELFAKKDSDEENQAK